MTGDLAAPTALSLLHARGRKTGKRGECKNSANEGMPPQFRSTSCKNPTNEVSGLPGAVQTVGMQKSIQLAPAAER